MKARHVLGILSLAALFAVSAPWASYAEEAAKNGGSPINMELQQLDAEAKLTNEQAYVVPDTLLAAFEEASKQYKVPRDLLIAIGWNESRLSNHEGLPSFENGYGMMNLVSNPVKQTLEKASQLSGLDVNLLKSDDKSNIMGAAALLAEFQKTANPEFRESPNLSDWSNAVKMYLGSENDELNVSYLQQVLGTSKLFIPSGNKVTIKNEIVISALAGKPVVKPIWKAAHPTNYATGNRGRGTITHLVIHVMQGTYAGSISWAQQKHDGPSAAHYYVRSSDGEITQMVKDKDIAYHARSANSYTIGIEHEGYISDPKKWFTSTMYNQSAKLAALMCYTYGIPVDRSHIKGHSEYPNQTHTDPGSGWDWTTYMRYVKAWYAEYQK
ncbi:N-acetylmuramoyl-L-alanine amidase [Paenibacillus elgii]|uniref:N-acetylmuramoyl-L-alanine amidase n=1 Tax=Paenibacillus elgii TaxID=189691 RepID=A0A2T6FZ97_9BACL|nr:N-acetylmuramoyl-L-alanine amidase [Paenibacillus elgii]PUA37243.1 N-acetylmuramoyl-L-alanine amidase [Paenibacillus elgii]